MRAKKVGTEQHGLRATGLLGDAAGGRSVVRVLVQIAEADPDVRNAFVANGEAPKRPAPPFPQFPAEPRAGSACDDAGRIRRNPKRGCVVLGQLRCGGSGIEHRLDRLAIDVDSQGDPRTVFLHGLDLDFAGSLFRPVRERHAVTIFWLVQPDCLVGQVELDIEPAEEILAKKDILTFAKVVFTGDEQLQTLRRNFAELEVVDDRNLHLRFATHAVHPTSRCLALRQVEPHGRGPQNQTPRCPGVQDDADLLAIDGAIHDDLVANYSDGPIHDPHELALGVGRNRASSQAQAGNKTRGKQRARSHRVDTFQHRGSTRIPVPPIIQQLRPATRDACVLATTILRRPKARGRARRRSAAFRAIR